MIAGAAFVIVQFVALCASYEPILRSLAAANGNVAYVPVLWRLCGSRICPIFRQDGLLMYADGDHISRAASESLAPTLEVLFSLPQAAESRDRLREDGVPIYRDGDHLSRQGSADLKPQMMNLLDTIDHLD